MFCLPQPSTRSLLHVLNTQLGRFLDTKDFDHAIREARHSLVRVATAVYFRMVNKMLPTPAKSHYTFNLRDLFKVRNFGSPLTSN